MRRKKNGYLFTEDTCNYLKWLRFEKWKYIFFFNLTEHFPLKLKEFSK